jgi:hypothetical protein
LKSALTTSKPDDNKEEEDRRKRKRDTTIIKEVLITEASLSLQKLTLTDNDDNGSSFEFVNGKLRNPNDITPYKGTGIIRAHFGKDKKHYLTEIEITKIIKKLVK